MCKLFFYSFFLSPLSNYFSSSTSTTTSSFPNIYNNSAQQNKKKEEENNHPTTKPNTTTKHRNLAQKINKKSTEKQLENPTQNQDNPQENPTQNQSKLTGKPNLKTVQTHCKTQPKSYSTENSRKKPNGVESAAWFAAVGSSIATTGSSIVVVGWGWARSVSWEWAGLASWVDELRVSEGKRNG